MTPSSLDSVSGSEIAPRLRALPPHVDEISKGVILDLDAFNPLYCTVNKFGISLMRSCSSLNEGVVLVGASFGSARRAQLCARDLARLS